MDKKLKWVCPHCDKKLDAEIEHPDFPKGLLEDFFTLSELEEMGLVVLNKMDRNWHKKCWEAFQAEYNNVLDSSDVNGSNGKDGN